MAGACSCEHCCLGKILGFRREQKNPRSLHTWRSNMAVPVFFLMKNMVFHPLQSQAATFAIFIKARTSSASKGHGSSSSAVASSSCQRPAEWFPLSKSACHNVVCGMHEIVEEHRHMCVCVSVCVYMCVYYLCVCVDISKTKQYQKNNQINIYVHIYIYIYMCVCVCMYVCIYVYMYIYMYICIYVYICVYVYYMYICKYVYVYIFMCV